ncbi:MAG: hypothetical protein NC342_03325 [Pseudoflavonifractor sp.]|nr:hypothetical protein [Alloprevotella sp.]MCM1116546.1 hypothetical protein [Pseudoflavonifractor sp.]
MTMMLVRVLALLCFMPVSLSLMGGEPARPVRTLREVCEAIAASGPEAIEGVWRLTDAPEGTTLVAIERETDVDGSYVVTLVEAPDRSLIPGTLLGRVTRGARRGSYDAWMLAEAPLPGVKVARRKDFTLSLSDDGNRLEFRPHRSPWAVNLYMSLPYLFVRPSVRNERHVERTPQGAERVFPVPYPPIEPIYL